MSKDNTLYRWVKASEIKMPEGYVGIIKIVYNDGKYRIYDCQNKWDSVTHLIRDSEGKHTTYWQEELPSSFLDEIRGEAYNIGYKKASAYAEWMKTENMHYEDLAKKRYDELPNKTEFISSFK